MHQLRRRPVIQATMAVTAACSALFASHAASQPQPAAPGMRPPAVAQRAPATPPRAAGQQAVMQDNLPRMSCTAVTMADPITLALGKSRIIQLPSPAIRLIGGGRQSSSIATTGVPQQPGGAGAPAGPRAASGGGSDGVAETEITLLSPNELLVLGRRPGSANVIVQDRDGRCQVRDIIITADPGTLQAKLRELMPRESGVRVAAAESAIVLAGDVSDTATLDQLMQVATAYGDGKKVVNLMRVSAPQQVMLEVKIAEVSKALLDRFGLDFARAVSSGDRTNFIQGIIGGTAGTLGRFGPNVSDGSFLGGAVIGVTPGGNSAAAASIQNVTRGASLLGLDLQNRDGIVRVLAEPNIMSISGQPASFLSGGKIFIPVAQSAQGGGTTITLEEKEFGVGLKFTPTVLDGRINLKVISEVSELSQSGTPFTTVAGVTAVLPSLTTRRVDTTVQLSDGQSFAVAGLIRNNVTEALNKFPGLGEAPVIGALFRSTEFQNDLTELLFVVTPRLVKPLTGAVTLPTDNHVTPSRSDVMLRGAGEGTMPPPAPAVIVPAQQPMRPGGSMPPPASPAMPSPGLPPTTITPRPSSGLPQIQTVATAAVQGATFPPAQPLSPLVPAALEEPPHFD